MTKNTLDKPITNLSEYVETINKINLRGGNLSQFIFRGQADMNWPISSGVVRRLTNAKEQSGYDETAVLPEEISLYLEDNIREARKREGTHPIIKGMSDLRLLTEMQHYGAATLLIDFSYSALIALYMAASDYAGKKGVHGKVFCINKNKGSDFGEIVDYKDFEEAEKKLSIVEILNDPNDKIRIYRPYHSNTRIIKQESIFIFTRTGIIDEDQIDFEIIIDKEAKEDIMLELQSTAGLYEETIYPDFLGYLQANNARKNYKLKKPIDYYQMGNESRQKAKAQDNNIELYQKAIENYSKAIELDSKFVEAYFERGYVYLIELKKFDEAIESFASATKLKPKDDELWYNLGLAYHDKALEHKKSEDFDKAIKSYKKSITLNKNSTRSLNNLADLYISLSQYGLALKYFKLGLSINENDGDLWFGLGELYYNQKKYKIALAKFTKAFDLNPKDDGAICYMGLCNLKLEELKAAEKCFALGLKVNMNNHECCNYLGVVYFKLKNNDKSQKYLSRCIQLKDDYAEAFNNLGFCYLRIGNLNDAEQNLNKAIELGCKDFGYKNKGHFYLCSDDKENALENYRLAKKEFKNPKELWAEFHNDYNDLYLRQYKIQRPEFLAIKNEV